MNSGLIAAIDLGTTKVTAAVARRDAKNRIELIALKDYPSKGIIRGDLRNVEQAASVLREIKADLEAQYGLVVNELFTGISGHHIKCNRASGYVFVHNSDRSVSEVSGDDVKRLIDEMRNTAVPIGQKVIDVLPQVYTLDQESDIDDPIGMEGKKLEAKFNIIVGEEAAIERLHRCFNRAELRVLGLILQPIASSESVLTEDDKELGVAVVDIGGGTTDLCIYHDKVIRHIAVLPIGGDMINSDIKSVGILERHVEKLKTQYGEAIFENADAVKYVSITSPAGQSPKEIAVKQLAQIIEHRVCDIIDFVEAQIEKSGYKGRLGAGVVLTGGGARLKHIDQLFKLKLGIESRVVHPSQHINSASLELCSSPSHSTIMGILIDAMRRGRASEVVVHPVKDSQTVSTSLSGGEHRVGNPIQSNGSINTNASSNEQAIEEDYDDYGEDDDKWDHYDKSERRGFWSKVKSRFTKVLVDVDDDD